MIPAPGPAPAARPGARAAALLCASAALLAAGCATYTARMAASGELYYEADYDGALGKLDGLVEEASNEDIKLLLLERGKVRLAAGEYDSAIVDLQEAERRFDEIEATVSVGEVLTTALVSEASREYQPDPHEKILVNTYLLLAYHLAGDREGARVERSRTIGRLERWADPGAPGERRPLDVPLARYLAALLYENEGLADDARIEYDAVRRLSPEAAPPAPNTHLTEIVFLAELGRSPVKVSREIRGYFGRHGGGIAGFFTLPGERGDVVFPLGGGAFFDASELGTVFTFAFPQQIPQPRVAASCAAVIDGVEAGPAVTLDDIEATSMEAFRRELPAILLKSAMRTYLQVIAQNKLDGKAGAVADVVSKIFSAVERADTRSWQTLPAEVAVFRMEVAPGPHEVLVRYYDEAGRYVASSPPTIVEVTEGRREIAWFPGPR